MRHHKYSIVYTFNNRIYRPGTFRDLALAKSLVNFSEVNLSENIQIISFKKYFYVLGNNLSLFCGGLLVVEAPRQLPSLPPLNPALSYASV